MPGKVGAFRWLRLTGEAELASIASLEQRWADLAAEDSSEVARPANEGAASQASPRARGFGGSGMENAG